MASSELYYDIQEARFTILIDIESVIQTSTFTHTFTFIFGDSPAVALLISSRV